MKRLLLRVALAAVSAMVAFSSNAQIDTEPAIMQAKQAVAPALANSQFQPIMRVLSSETQQSSLPFFSPMDYGQAKAQKTIQRRASRALPAEATFYGSMVYDGYRQGSGIFSFSTTDSEGFVKVVNNSEIKAEGGGVYVDGKYAMTRVITNYATGGIYGLQNIVYETQSWMALYYGDMQQDDFSTYFCAMAYDQSTGNIFTCGYNKEATALVFGTLDISSWIVTPIREMEDEQYMAMGVSNDGTLYAIDSEGLLKIVDKKTGISTVVGNTGVTTYYLCGGTIDASTDTFYYFPCTVTSSYLYAIDLKSAEATLCYETPYQMEVCGIYFTTDVHSDSAPATAKISSLDFNYGAQNGTIAFTTPSTLYDGSAPAEGASLDYDILANGTEIASGSDIEYGKEYTVEVSLATPGLYNFAVRVKNEDGYSLSESESLYVGYDIPNTVENIRLRYENGVMNLSWDAVTGTEHDGAIGSLTYRVYDQNGNLEAEALTATNWSKPVEDTDELVTYTYSVTAVNEGQESAYGISNTAFTGGLEIPYQQSFTYYDDYSQWEIFKAGGEALCAANYSGLRFYNQSSSALVLDYWLFSPAIKFQRDQYYEVTISFSSLIFDPSTPEYISVWFGHNKSVEEMTLNLKTYCEHPTEVTAYTFGFVSDESMEGNNYLSIHFDGPYAGNIIFKSIEIEGKSKLTPNAPTDLKVEKSLINEPECDFSCILPAVDMGGDSLTSITKFEVLANDEIVSTAENLTPGAPYSFHYIAPETGTVTFTARAYNEYGEGAEAETSIFLGYNLPVAPENVLAIEESLGIVKITWDPVTADIDGNPIPQEYISYTIIDANGIVDEGIQSTEYIHKACEPTERTFAQYRIYAESPAGMSSAYGVSSFLAIGEATPTPFVENFPNAEMSHQWAFSTNGTGCTVEVVPFSKYGHEEIVDNGGVLRLDGWAGYYIAFASEKIHIMDESPILSFFTYNDSRYNYNEFKCKGNLRG
ncbi:MAG: hypothetical protein LIP03_16215 [Bacteroidales bacterium]|nr:hypothetical protein [Bacteroidales bacterium]